MNRPSTFFEAAGLTDDSSEHPKEAAGGGFAASPRQVFFSGQLEGRRHEIFLTDQDFGAPPSVSKVSKKYTRAMDAGQALNHHSASNSTHPPGGD